MMSGGMIVDTTTINAPTSTKNASGNRDPEMHQMKKGTECYFGMKCHAGVDAGTGYIHSIEATSANVHDITQAVKLIRADNEVVYGDSGYLGVDKLPGEGGCGRFFRQPKRLFQGFVGTPVDSYFQVIF